MIFVAAACVGACLGLVLVDPVCKLWRHLTWRRAWKRDGMSTYRWYLSELERVGRQHG